QPAADALPVTYGTASTTGGLAWRTSNNNPIDIGSRSLLGFTEVQGSTAGPSAIQHLTSTLTLEAVTNADHYLGFSTAAGNTSGPSAIQNLNASLSLEGDIAPPGSLDLSNEVRLDGSGTPDIHYL
ncbi:hypothetical protein, partial [Citrobacter portucalensis]|uniref:hypothetical protein n=1 Tax=Citrobacter portucalensis TaxID=1639133 RepID=UPI00301E525D